MKSLLTWIKANPITLVSGFVALLSLIFIVWIRSQGAGLVGDMDKRAKVVGDLSRMSQTSLTIPPPSVNERPQTLFGITLNPAIIDAYRLIQEEMLREVNGVASLVQERGSANRPLLETESLFPGPAATSVRFRARSNYLRAFSQMLAARPLDSFPPRLGEVLPKLNAGMPPTPEELSEAINQRREQFVNSVIVPGATQPSLTGEQEEELGHLLRQTTMNLLRGRAAQLHLYAETDLTQPDFPFEVQPWAASTQGLLPTMPQLWEAQMDLWFQQDIAQVLALTNRADDANRNVETNPIKRLLQVRLQPGYVGLHTGGALKLSSGASSTGSQRPDFSAMPMDDPMTPTPTPTRPEAESYYKLMEGAQTTSGQDIARQMNPNFHLSPTGRVSNALYYVRHATVVLHADVQALPELFRAIGQVGFMTVLKCDLRDVDEYLMLHDRFVYGEADVVQVELVIESLWLRSQLDPLMPAEVRPYMGVPEPRP